MPPGTDIVTRRDTFGTSWEMSSRQQTSFTTLSTLPPIPQRIAAANGGYMSSNTILLPHQRTSNARRWPHFAADNHMQAQRMRQRAARRPVSAWSLMLEDADLVVGSSWETMLKLLHSRMLARLWLFSHARCIQLQKACGHSRCRDGACPIASLSYLTNIVHAKGYFWC